MRRRDFLKSALVTSASAFLAWPRARADAACGAVGPLFISIEASGAWDPTFLCDPHGDEAFTFYRPEHIGTATTSRGQLRYAPYRLEGDTPQYYEVGGSDFFQKHKERLLVINGLDTATVSHPVGARHVFSGSVREGRPALAALVAGVRGPTLPLSFLSMGGYDATAGVVAVSRVSNPGMLQSIARPAWVAPLNLQNPARFHNEAVEQLLSAAQDARDARLLEGLRLPAQRRALEALRESRESARGLAIVGADAQPIPPSTSDNPAIASIDTLLAAMRTGICAAGHIVSGGFDTHQEHDSLTAGVGHRPSLARLLEAIDHLIAAFESDPVLSARGALVLVGSDFARTRYNGPAEDPERGKDHWPTTSALVFALGAAAPQVIGGRTLGVTETRNAMGQPFPGQQARPWVQEGNRLRSGEVGEPGAFALGPVHLVHALRNALGLCADDPLVARFSLDGAPAEPLPLLRV